jgi:cell fate regulator YaaT (PSP1 superfamily)
MSDQHNPQKPPEQKPDRPEPQPAIGDKPAAPATTPEAAAQPPQAQSLPETKPVQAPASARPEPARERRLVGVKFRTAGKTYFFDSCGLELVYSEPVIVETENGLALGKVATACFTIPVEQCPPDLKPVVRKASRSDLERERKNRERENQAFRACQAKIRQRGLEMKLVRVELLHDGSRAIFYYTADQRVDFRELVKDLAHELHTRIEMRQIGVRDESKLVGGLGNCGRILCCASFLTDFSPVSVRMAKDQCLAMNPSKVSGLCGRLMCCLSYEHPVYQELLGKMPKRGSSVDTPEGKGTVLDLNPILQTVLVQLPETVKNFQAVQVKEIAPPKESAIPEELKNLEG